MQLTRKGASLIEMMLSLTILVPLFGLLLSMAYLIVARTWVQHIVHEGLFCLSSQTDPLICKQDCLKRMGVLPFVQKASFKWNKLPHQISGEMTWSWHDDWTEKEQQTLQIPLQSSKIQTKQILNFTKLTIK